jgi:hypothetical protein
VTNTGARLFLLAVEMSIERVGYARLAQQNNLPIRELPTVAVIDSKLNARSRRSNAQHDVLSFPSRYRPDPGIAGDLQFALRYEGVNLELLYLLFQNYGFQELQKWLTNQPESAYARRAGFLFEWLTDQRLKVNISAKARFTPLLDEELQFAKAGGTRDPKFRVINNLPGTREFCPLIRRTPYINSMLQMDLQHRAKEQVARYDPKLLVRAAAYLYLKETHSSFDIEREKASPARAQRFVDLLRHADSGIDLSEDRLVELQNAVVDERFAEAAFRRAQNWIGKDLRYRKQVDFVPPRPEDVPALMQGLAAMARQAPNAAERIDPVALAASIAFGFVFIHPFIDGNGRLHRYLIHQLLAVTGFTPKGIILPVSAVILANLDRYVEVLERFSKPLRERTRYNPDTPSIVAEGNDALYFRFFDATEQTAFLFWVLERTVGHDLEQEVNYLQGYDRAFTQLNQRLDWPGHSLDTFINVVAANGGRLSETKRKSHFAQLTQDEISEFEAVVQQAFEKPPA